MRFEIWKSNPPILARLNAEFDPRFPECCGCDAKLQGDEVQFEFTDGRPGHFPVCLDCIPGWDVHPDPVKLAALRERAERRAVQILARCDGEEGRAGE